MSPSLQFDIAHLLAGGMVVVSFMLLYQDRMFGLLHAFTLHALLQARERGRVGRAKVG